MSEGYITLSRQFFSHPFWTDKKNFDRADAWIDLIQMAAFSDHKKLVKGRLIEVERGCLVASIRFLSTRWRWSNSKVVLFLATLNKAEMIEQEKRQENTYLTLCNYDTYNPTKDGKATGKRQESDRKATGKRQREEGTKKVQEGIKNNTAIPESLTAIAGFESEWGEFKTHRKAKKASMTPRVEELLLKKLSEKPDKALDALQTAQTRGWTGFEWSWLENGKNGNRSKTEAERDAENTGYTDNIKIPHIKMP